MPYTLVIYRCEQDRLERLNDRLRAYHVEEVTNAADALMALRSGAPLLLPPRADQRVARMVDLADRCRHIVDLALDDDGGAITAHEAAARRAPLVRLDAAARRAMVAACSHPWVAA